VALDSNDGQDRFSQTTTVVLPLVEDKGQSNPLYQPSLEKTLAILKQQTLNKEFGSKVSIRTV